MYCKYVKKKEFLMTIHTYACKKFAHLSTENPPCPSDRVGNYDHDDVPSSGSLFSELSLKLISDGMNQISVSFKIVNIENAVVVLK